MKSKLNLFKPIYIALLTVSALVVVLTAFADTKIFLVSAGLWLIAFVYMMLRLRAINREIAGFLEQMGEMLADVQSAALTEFPIPVLVARGNQEIVWYNELCKESVLGSVASWGRYIDELLPDVSLDAPCPPDGYNVEMNGRQFTVFVIAASRSNESMYVLYFIDDNDLKMVAAEYFESRESVLLLSIDNYDEMFQNAKENERGMVMGRIEEVVEAFAADNGALLRKLSKDSYLCIVEERYMRAVMAERFSLLDQIRAIETPNKIVPTISIGVGRDAKTLQEAERMARQSLDMALGRGGDQAAVKTKAGFEFYGGTSKAIEKRNKVRTRVIANALSEIVATSDNVIVMGHRYGDLDSLGASVGMLKTIETMGKPAVIALNKDTTLAKPLYDRLMEAGGYEDKIVSPEAARELVGRNTLLIVVDTHIKGVLESRELYEACRNVVVVDHHRKMVDHIENAVIFYHEPYASSASEMVSEITQYLEEVKLSPIEADALLSGITLDTRSFTMRTGVRTFEAAAYLRRMGADTIKVKQLFATTMEVYKGKSALVAAAQLFGDCAVSTTDQSDGSVRLTAPQAADEMLSIEGVEASFVLYPEPGGVSMSARSMGNVNVQLIMEKLGGGGHQTMAGAQIQSVDVEEAKSLLLTAIEDYRKETSVK